MHISRLRETRSLPFVNAGGSRNWRCSVPFYGKTLDRKVMLEVLIRFHPEVQHSLLDMARMRQELSRMLGREVDLVERTVVERSRNYIRRKSILQTAEKLVWRRPSLRS